ncbi:hypothetical protein DV736_g175, partial [Chaetothyriales sp. CBS 134916]
MADLENARRSSRASLRQVTFINPRTGARMHQAVTLHGYMSESAEVRAGSEAQEALRLAIADDTGSVLVRQARWLAKTRQIVAETASTTQTFVTSDVGKGMFKCALAYLLGSLATFVPVLSELFGQNDLKHLVSTITVYFHPARSLGNMLEALMLAFGAFCYTAVMAVAGMSVTVFFADTVDLIALGRLVVLVVFVGGGLGFIAWVKVKKGDPLVNVACSLASLTLISTLTREAAVQRGDYSFEKISQILRMLVAGVIATTLVNFFVFPISGRQNLKKNLVDTCDALSDLLALTTSSFLSGDEAELDDQIFSNASARHRKALATMARNLKESKYEHLLLGTEQQVAIEAKLVNCIRRMTQSVGGLRTAAAMQFEVIKEAAQNQSAARTKYLKSLASMTATPATTTRATTPRVTTPMMQRTLSLDFVQDRINKELISHRDSESAGVSDDLPLHTTSQIFDLFIDRLGPSMRSLAFTLKEILYDVPFDPADGYRVSANPKFRLSLDRAMQLYRHARREAIDAVYAKKGMDLRHPLQVEADWEEAAACCGHFSDSLLDFADETKKFLTILDEMQLELEEEPSGRSWAWLKFWSRKSMVYSRVIFDDSFEAIPPQGEDQAFLLASSGTRTQQPDSSQESPLKWKRIKRRFFRRVYESLSFTRRDDVKYAIKVGLGAILYALPGFIPSTRPIYAHWRGEWGLLSYMLVCSMTIGASNTTGYSRVYGTILGAVLAIAFWHVSNENAVVLALMGVGMAYWTSWITLGLGKGPMARFIMLTYNLIALYAYRLAVADNGDDRDEEDGSQHPLIVEIAWHRVVAVISGCLWGLIITRVVWPISAREKLKEGLTLLWLRMGLIWKRDPLSCLVEGEQTNRYMDLREEFELRGFMTKLRALAETSKSEFEMRGAFPDKVYSRILNSTEQMLDAFHTMNVAILKDLSATPGEAALLKTTLQERAQLCSRISHLLTVMASSMKLEYALDRDILPNIDHTRDRLLIRIFMYREEDAVQELTTDEDFGILYTYALVTGQLSLEIGKVLKEVETLFGTLDEEALQLQ